MSARIPNAATAPPPRWRGWLVAAAVGATLVPAGQAALRRLAPASEPVDATLTGALGDGDATLPEDGSFYDDHPVHLDAGWRLEARLESDAFDAWLQLFGPGGAPIAQNDDAGPGTSDAALTITARRAGRYVLRANSREPGMRGAYRLRIRAAPVTPRPAGPRPARGSGAPGAAASSSP